jgi:hypothetical protein
MRGFVLLGRAAAGRAAARRRASRQQQARAHQHGARSWWGSRRQPAWCFAKCFLCCEAVHTLHSVSTATEAWPGAANDQHCRSRPSALPVWASSALTAGLARRQGYGLVRFCSAQDAQAAIEKFHGTELEGRTLTVRLDKCGARPWRTMAGVVGWLGAACLRAGSVCAEPQGSGTDRHG